MGQLFSLDRDGVSLDRGQLQPGHLFAEVPLRVAGLYHLGRTRRRTSVLDAPGPGAEIAIRF